MATFKKNIFKLCFFWFITFLLLIPSVLADTTDIGYTTNKTSVIISNNRGGDVNLAVNHTNTSSVLADINSIIISVSQQNFLANTIYQLEIGTPDAKFDTNINSFIVSGYNTSCRYYGMANINTSYPSIYFSCPSNTSYVLVSLNTIAGNQNITTGSNFRWSYTFIRKLDDSSDMDFGPVITNQTQNTENIINNNNNNTDKIINNQNELFGKKCDNLINKNDVTNGAITYNSTSETLDFNKNSLTSGWFPCKPNTTYIISGGNNRSRWQSKDISGNITFIPDNNVITTNSSAAYCRVYYFFDANIIANKDTVPNIMVNEGSTSKSYCEYGTYSSKLDDQTNAINGLNDSLNDDDSSGATSEASDFFSSFSTNTFGLTSIITAPLNLIRSVLSSTCTTLQLPLPYLDNKKLELPCMSTIYSQFFGSFFTIYQTITYGIIAYWVCVRIFNQVKDFKNPEHDEIEVMDL